MLNRRFPQGNSLPLGPLAFVIALALSFVQTASLSAHPVSLTDAYVYVAKNSVRAKIEVYAEDLYLYGLVEPDAEGMLDPEQMKAAAEKFAPHVVESFYLLDAKGERLKGTLSRTRTDAMPSVDVRPENLMRYRIVYDVEYQSEQPLEFLTFQKRPLQLNTIKKNELPTQFTLYLKQEQSARREQELLLPGEPLTLRFDWEGEKLSSSASVEQWQQWYLDQRQQQLGIDDYGRVYSFVYVTPYEIRHEIVIPIITMETLLEQPPATEDFLDTQAQATWSRKIRKLMTENGVIRINEADQLPANIEVQFLGLENRDLASSQTLEKVSRINGRVGMILTYPQTETPQKVSLCWNLFNDSVQRVYSVLYAGLKSDANLFSEGFGRNCVEWNNEGELSRPDTEVILETRSPPVQWQFSWAALAFALVFSIRVIRHHLNGHKRQAKVLGATGLVLTVILWNTTSAQMISPFNNPQHLTEDDFQQRIQALLDQAYSAFDQPNEGQILSQLQQAMSTPDLVRTAYLDILDGLKLEGSDGLQARVLDVDVSKVEQIEPKAYNKVEEVLSAIVTWKIVSRIDHWGHQHLRETEYQALVTLRSNWKQWKIAGLAIQQANQLKAETTVREALVD